MSTAAIPGYPDKTLLSTEDENSFSGPHQQHKAATKQELFAHNTTDNDIARTSSATLTRTTTRASRSSSEDEGGATGTTSSSDTDDEAQTKSKLKHQNLRDTEFLKFIEHDSQVHPENFNLEDLRKALPKKCFQKDLARSLKWMVFDLAVVFSALTGLKMLYRGELDGFLFLDNSSSLISTSSQQQENNNINISSFHTSILLKPVLAIFLYWLAGFFMWANFVVGHDCGHGTFSNNSNINFFFGNLTHGAIFVPFQSWARSHRFHHMYHNHLDKDYSFPWAHDPKFDKACSSLVKNYPAIPAAVYPVFGYAFYLLWPQQYGGVDGTHYFPNVFSGCRLWENVDTQELIKCWISVFVVLAYGYWYTQCFFNGNFSEFAIVYLPAWFTMCFYLYTVTYLQHHNPTVKVYDNTTWKYSTAAFETVDRTFGSVIDLFHHHITDCHVIHHLFFTKIPHYHLKEATIAMQGWLKEKGLYEELYQFEYTRDYFLRVFQYMYSHSTRAKLLTKDEKFFLEEEGDEAVKKTM
ncbi:unnamed protein product [Amoebophrya sp. A120]|nr:unnamed protein product [Amoebophrya sp. A120]|eukprot:GSA120T00019813001.1